MDAINLTESALAYPRYQPKSAFKAAWVVDFNTLDQHNESDRLFIVGCMERGMWDDEPRDSAYWLESYKGYMRKYQRVCRDYYAPNTDKRTKRLRMLKADMVLFNNFASICELYYRRELKREGKPDALPLC
jgi:hypothetical protein